MLASQPGPCLKRLLAFTDASCMALRRVNAARAVSSQMYLWSVMVLAAVQAIKE